MNLAANLQFMSSEYDRQNSVNYNDILSQQVFSSANFSKRWDDNSSLSINYSRSQDLQNGTINETLPNLSYTRQVSYPFKREGSEALRSQKWYELIGYSYSGRFQNNRNKNSDGLKIRGGIQHDISLNASPKIGYFNISPNFSIQKNGITNGQRLKTLF
jgi:hypothetical protein